LLTQRKRQMYSWAFHILFSKTGPQIDAKTRCIKAEVSKSVGLIYVTGRNGSQRGTGFRVGNEYIMTCLHVIKDIIEGLYEGHKTIHLIIFTMYTALKFHQLEF
jgi:hypothetical protein